ncbi:MAG TPA: MarR family transcriptional regulator [Thermomicrobiales bacterium]|jgi:DNA-binding MarR family transcriptional regulator|nr:MarR family transcriptional regulator [Thermomicrobiales bacterium]
MSSQETDEPADQQRRQLAGRMMQVLPFFGSWTDSVRDQRFGSSNLGHRQIQILYTLRHGLLATDDVTPSALATLFGVQPSVITRVLSRLESSGHITRTVDPRDARSQFIRITPEGYDVSVAVERYYLDSMIESMAFLTDEDLPVLEECMAKLSRIAIGLENRRRASVGREPLPFPDSPLPYQPDGVI